MNRKMRRARSTALRRRRLPNDTPVAFDVRPQDVSVDNAFTREPNSKVNYGRR